MDTQSTPKAKLNRAYTKLADELYFYFRDGWFKEQYGMSYNEFIHQPANNVDQKKRGRIENIEKSLSRRYESIR
jgi:hypothetical protein